MIEAIEGEQAKPADPPQTLDMAYKALLKSFAELQSAALAVIEETDQILATDEWPTKYRAPYGSLAKLRTLLGQQYGLK